MSLGAVAQPSDAQPHRIESAFPRQLPPGQTTVIHVAISSRDAIQAAELSPAQGLKVSRIQQRETTQGVLTWSELTIEAALDAAPGTRTLVLVLPPPTGRTAPLPLTVPTHAPSVADMRVLSASSTRSTIELQLAASDASAISVICVVWSVLAAAASRSSAWCRASDASKCRNILVRRVSPPARASHREMRSAGEVTIRGVSRAHVEDSVTFTPERRGAEPFEKESIMSTRLIPSCRQRWCSRWATVVRAGMGGVSQPGGTVFFVFPGRQR